MAERSLALMCATTASRLAIGTIPDDATARAATHKRRAPTAAEPFLNADFKTIITKYDCIMNPETLIDSFELNQNYTSDGHSVIAGENFTTYSYKDQPIIKYFFKSQHYIIYKPPFKKSILNILESFSFYPEYDKCDKNTVYKWIYYQFSGHISDRLSIKIETMKNWKPDDDKVVLINPNVPYAIFTSEDKAIKIIKHEENLLCSVNTKND